MRQTIALHENALSNFSNLEVEVITKCMEDACSTNLVSYYYEDILSPYHEDARLVLSEYDWTQDSEMNSDPNPSVFYALYILYGAQLIRDATSHAEVMNVVAKSIRIINGLDSNGFAHFTGNKIQSWIGSMMSLDENNNLPFQEKQQLLDSNDLNRDILSTIIYELSS